MLLAMADSSMRQAAPKAMMGAKLAVAGTMATVAMMAAEDMMAAKAAKEHKPTIVLVLLKALLMERCQPRFS